MVGHAFRGHFVGKVRVGERGIFSRERELVDARAGEGVAQGARLGGGGTGFADFAEHFGGDAAALRRGVAHGKQGKEGEKDFFHKRDYFSDDLLVDEFTSKLVDETDLSCCIYYI